MRNQFSDATSLSAAVLGGRSLLSLWTSSLHDAAKEANEEARRQRDDYTALRARERAQRMADRDERRQEREEARQEREEERREREEARQEREEARKERHEARQEREAVRHIEQLRQQAARITELEAERRGDQLKLLQLQLKLQKAEQARRL